MKKYFLMPLALLNTDSFVIKIGASLAMSISLSPIILFFLETFQLAFSSKLFLQILSICLIADLTTGIAKHFINKTIDLFKMLFGFIKKIGVSLTGMALFNALSAIEAGDTYTEWVKVVGMVLVYVYVGGSASTNLYVITGGKFPPLSFMKRLDRFNQNLDVKELISTKTSDINEINQEPKIEKK